MLKKNKGATIIFITLMVMSTILFVSLAIGDIVIANLKTAKTQHNSTIAYFAAEAGAEEMMYYIRNHFIDTGDHLDETYSDCDTNSTVCYDHATNIPVSINGCDNGCATPNRNLLSSGSTYGVEYTEETGVDVTRNFRCIGSYKDTQRVIKLSY